MYSIDVRNANNHQCTYGVVHSAVTALMDYMLTENDYGLMDFEVWDGDNQVGVGSLGLLP